MLESFLVLNALGGECLDDFDRLREDDQEHDETYWQRNRRIHIVAAAQP
jgi:hypothetical protein